MTKSKDELIAELQTIIDDNTRQTIKARCKPQPACVWWIQYYADERKSLAVQYKLLTGNDLDPKEEAKSDEGKGGSGGGGKECVHTS